MKRVVKSRSRLVKPLTYRPQCERLEVRSQPGSMLTNIGAAAGASMAELSQATTQEMASQAAVVSFGLSNLNSQLHNTTSMEGGAVVGSPSTVQVTNVTPTAPVELNIQSGLSAQQQAQAVSVATPVATHGFTLSNGSGHSAISGLSARTDLVPSLVPQTPDAVHMTAVANAMFHTADLQSVSNVQVLASGSGITPFVAFTPIYTSFLGFPGAPTPFGPSSYNSVKGQPDSTAIVAGSFTDPNTGVSDAVIEKISNDGSTVQGFIVLGDSTGATSVTATGADQDNTGDGGVYFNATATANDGSGTSQIVFGRILPDFSNLGWGGQTFTFNGVTAGNGAKINNGNLYLSGNATDSTSGFNDVFAVRISNLQDDPTQLVVTGAAYGFADGSGNPIATTGLNVTGDANGNAFTAGSYSTADLSDTEALSVAPSNDFSTAIAFGLGFAAGIQNQGQYTSVDIDNSGPGGDTAVYAAGSVFVHPTTGINHFAQAYTKYDGITGNGIYIDPMTGNVVGGWLWQVTNGQGGPFLNWFATGNHADQNGGIHAAHGYILDPADPMNLGGETLFRVGPNGDTVPDNAILGVAGSAEDDRSTGMDIGPDIFTGGVDYYLVGVTNGPDFQTTPGSFQSAYPGDPANPTYQGWISDGIVA